MIFLYKILMTFYSVLDINDISVLDIIDIFEW